MMTKINNNFNKTTAVEVAKIWIKSINNMELYKIKIKIMILTTRSMIN